MHDCVYACTRKRNGAMKIHNPLYCAVKHTPKYARGPPCNILSRVHNDLNFNSDVHAHLHQSVGPRDRYTVENSLLLDVIHGVHSLMSSTEIRTTWLHKFES